ncbi:unnamed protein product [Calypogeia fissa]
MGFKISLLAILVLTLASLIAMTTYTTATSTSTSTVGELDSGSDYKGEVEEDYTPQDFDQLSPSSQPENAHVDHWTLEPGTHEFNRKCENDTIDWNDVEDARQNIGTLVQLPMELVHDPSEGQSWTWKGCGTYGKVDVSVGYRDDHPDGTRSDVSVGWLDLEAAIDFLKKECCAEDTNCRGGDYVIGPKGGDQEVTIRVSKSKADVAHAPEGSTVPKSKSNVDSANRPESSGLSKSQADDGYAPGSSGLSKSKGNDANAPEGSKLPKSKSKVDGANGPESSGLSKAKVDDANGPETGGLSTGG